ncbi:MAG: sugar phosphate isomerase/epimerase family protein [Armatimonadota bacterium]
MRLGFDDHTLICSGHSIDSFVFMDEVVRYGLEGIHFSVAIDVFASFDDDYLKRVRDYAAERGLYLELGMGACNPLSRCRTLRDANRDPEESLRGLIRAAAVMGVPVVRTFLGFLEERATRGTPKFQEHLAATKKVLDAVKGYAEETNVRVAVENHLDLTSVELRELIEAVDSPCVGVCFDFGNPLTLLEDPIEACRTLLPYICSTHFKDGVLIPWEGAWVAAPLGAGQGNIVEVARLIAGERPEVNFSHEDLPDIFLIPTHNAAFMGSLPHMQTEQGRERLRVWLEQSKEMQEKGLLDYVEQLKDPDTRGRVIAGRIPDNVLRAKSIQENRNASFETRGVAQETRVVQLF